MLQRPPEPLAVPIAPRPDASRATELTAAFQSFAISAKQLEGAYHALRERAAQIDQELAVANDQLRAKVGELNELNSYLANILESMQSGVVAVDRKGVITRMNRAAEELLHAPARKAVGAPYHEIVRETDGSASLVVDVMRGKHACGLLQREIVLPGGGRMTVESSLTLLRNGRRVIGCLDIFRDLTEIEALQGKLRNADRLATLGQMAACVAHEVRNPLNAVEGFAKLLARDCEGDDTQGRYAQNIISAVRNLERTVTGLLIFARPYQLSVETVSLRSVADQTVALVEQELAERGVENTELQTEFLHDRDRIGADGEQLGRALLNLMRNACEAMPNGGRIKLRTRIGGPPKGQAGRQVEIQVSDTGDGVPKDIAGRLFQPFATSKTGGTGLGLAIVQKVAELHKGEVLWNSTPGEGTTFTLRIPLRCPEESATAATQEKG